MYKTVVDFWSLLCRGRKKKVVILLMISIFLTNAMLYFSLELYHTIRGRSKNASLHLDKKSYFNKMSYVYKNTYFDNKSYVDKTVTRVTNGQNPVGNLTEDIIHRNNYAPAEGAGKWGLPVQLSPRELIKAQEFYLLHSYNVLVSDKISINRSLPDMRSDSCRTVKFDLTKLPTASVIIVFHNEAWSTLMRTVMSVIQRSPHLLLKQIILVDDASDRRYLGKELDDAVANLDKVLILRSEERSGLVGARLLGARSATGDILVFLDAHCEVTQGWLEPLLDRAGSADVFICPHIDILCKDTLAYKKSIDAHWGAFSWGLHFRWLTPSSEDMLKMAENPSKPYPTPAMAGGLFAVKKGLFWRLGGYDEGMLIWGAENLELSWRAWQCGAGVEITPCSRVGHIFSRHGLTESYQVSQKINLARAATVWMDDWADFFFKFSPFSAAVRSHQNVANRVQLRKNLQCKSYKWYLENVWPQHFFPTNDRWFGRIRSEVGGCLGISGMTRGLAGPATRVQCGSDYDLENLVIYTPEGKVMADGGLCLEHENKRVVWQECRDGSKQIWNREGPRLKNNGLCLTLIVNSKDANGISEPLKVKRCFNIDEQNWEFERVPWR